MVFEPLQPPERPEDSESITSWNRLHLPLGTTEQNDALHTPPSLSPAPYPPQPMNSSTATPPTLSLPDPVGVSTEQSAVYLEPGPPQDALGLDINDNVMDHRNEDLGDDRPSSAALVVENAGNNYAFKWWGITLTLPRSYFTRCHRRRCRYDCRY
jgi:hypothetical protein